MAKYFFKSAKAWMREAQLQSQLIDARLKKECRLRFKSLRRNELLRVMGEGQNDRTALQVECNWDKISEKNAQQVHTLKDTLLRIWWNI